MAGSCFLAVHVPRDVTVSSLIQRSLDNSAVTDPIQLGSN